MKKTVIKISIVTVFFSVLAITGCEKILEPEIQGQVALDHLVTSENGLITAVNGIYTPLQALYVGPMQRLTDMASDDGWTWRNELEPDLFIAEPVFSHSQSVWVGHYRGITRANTVIDNLDKVTFSKAETGHNIEGQAKFLRAFYYFNLVRLFGGVPLIVNEIKSREDSEMPRASVREVYDQIKKDLVDARSLLPETFSSGYGNEAGRATSLAASSLLSLVHLELEEWDQAVENMDRVIGKKTLQPNYASYFNGSAENGAGSLFEVQYGGVDASNTSTLSNFLAPTALSGGAIILPTDDNLEGKGGGPSSGNGIIQAYEEQDLRKQVNFNTYGLANIVDATQPAGSLYYVHKFYNTRDPLGRSTWNYPLIRYPEIILAKAEALNEIGYQADGEAFDLLNQIRRLAGVPAYTSVQLATQQDFRNAIRKERRLELAFEAKRYFDLNRWGILKESIQPQLDFLKISFPTHRTVAHPVTGKNTYLYPIPAIEFVNNAQLGEQNPGYNN